MLPVPCWPQPGRDSEPDMKREGPAEKEAEGTQCVCVCVHACTLGSSEHIDEVGFKTVGFFVLFCLLLGIKPRALYRLGKCSNAKPRPRPLTRVFRQVLYY